MARYGYKIAQGWNNTAGLANFESISVSGGEDLHGVVRRIAANCYFLPQTFLPYAPNFVLSAGGSYSQAGYAKCILLFPLIGAKSYDYLATTYGQDNTTYRGKVTLTFRSNDFNTYANYNALLKLADAPKPIFQQNKYWYQDVQATFLIRGTA